MNHIDEPRPAGRRQDTRLRRSRKAAVLATAGIIIMLSAGAGISQENGYGGARSEGRQRGRARYVVDHIPLSLGYCGLLEGMIEPGDARLGVGLYMLTAGGFIAGSFAIPTTPAQAHLSIAYGYRGTLTGLGLAEVLKLNDSRTLCFLGLVSGIAAEMCGYGLAKGMVGGQAQLMSTYTDVGIVGGGLLWGATSVHGDPVPWLILGEGLGATAGYLRQRTLSYTEGQALFVRTAGLLGAGAPIGLTYTIAGSDGLGFLDGRFAAGTALLGSIGATYYAERYIGRYPLTSGGGVACAGMTAAGALIGGGIGYLLSPSHDVNRVTGRVITGFATVGALGGMVAGLAIAKRSLGQSEGSSLLPGNRLAVDWSAIPVSALRYARDRQFSAPGLVTFRF